MSTYNTFIFKDYIFEPSSGTLRLFYGYDEALEFCETYQFDFDFTSYDSEALDRAVQLLFFMAGVSYYKMYLAPEIQVLKGSIDEPLAQFLGKTYQRGLGEYFYVNKLDPTTPVVFPVNHSGLAPQDTGNLSGLLSGVGGGKDSLVSIELLNGQPQLATWSLNHRSQLEPLVTRIGTKHLWVNREWDKQLLTLKDSALNGHIPISAIFSCVGAIVAILGGFRDTIVSNESSASEPTLHYQGTAINHQYSKSLEYEQDFQAVLARTFGDSLRYYSLLRPFTELRIAELFAGLGWQKYKDVFSSCNRAYTHDQNHMFWCGQCAKCAFVFLILTPFVPRQELETLWDGRNLLLDPANRPVYEQLLGISGDKPLDCVGEVKESRAAMRLSQAIYPELQSYQFDLPADYDFRVWSESSMPEEILAAHRTQLVGMRALLI